MTWDDIYSRAGICLYTIIDQLLLHPVRCKTFAVWSCYQSPYFTKTELHKNTCFHLKQRQLQQVISSHFEKRNVCGFQSKQKLYNRDDSGSCVTVWTPAVSDREARRSWCSMNSSLPDKKKMYITQQIFQFQTKCIHACTKSKWKKPWQTPESAVLYITCGPV